MPAIRSISRRWGVKTKRLIFAAAHSSLGHGRPRCPSFTSLVVMVMRTGTLIKLSLWMLLSRWLRRSRNCSDASLRRFRKSSRTNIWVYSRWRTPTGQIYSYRRQMRQICALTTTGRKPMTIFRKGRSSADQLGASLSRRRRRNSRYRPNGTNSTPWLRRCSAGNILPMMGTKTSQTGQYQH